MPTSTRPRPFPISEGPTLLPSRSSSTAPIPLPAPTVTLHVSQAAHRATTAARLVEQLAPHLHHDVHGDILAVNLINLAFAPRLVIRLERLDDAHRLAADLHLDRHGQTRVPPATDADEPRWLHLFSGRYLGHDVAVTAHGDQDPQAYDIRDEVARLATQAQS